MKSASAPPQADPLNYVEPYWSSKPIYPYYIETIREGVLLDVVQLDSKSFFTLGRSPQCDIAIDSPSASRRHAIIQHKDTGAVFIYDLGSTHGTFLNKHIVPPFKYIEMHVGDHIRLGVSSKSFVLGGPEELQPQEGERKGVERSGVSKEEVYRRRVEQVHRLNEERERNKIRYKHDEGGINWGMDPDFDEQPPEADLSEDEELPNDLNELLKNSILTDKQKSLIEKCNDLTKKIEKLGKEREVTEKKAELGLDELTYKQQKGLDAMADKIAKLKKQEADTRNALKASFGKSKKENEGRKFKWDEDEFNSDDDEFYDRTKQQKKTEAEQSKAEAEHETYESLKTKLELLLKERQALVSKLMEKPSSKTQEDEDDPLEQFMASNNVAIQKNKSEKLELRMLELTEEIDKCNSMLRYVTPTFATLQSSKLLPKDSKDSKADREAEENKDQGRRKKKNTEMSLAETMQRLEEMRREREKREQAQIQSELRYEAQSVNEKAEPSEEVEAPKVQEDVELDPGNYFTEIVKNRNKDSINLDDYGMIKERYAEYERRKQELEKCKANAPAEKKYGLEYVFKRPEKDEGEMGDLFVGKRPIQSAGVVDPVSKKVRRVQGPTPKPVPRNVAENPEDSYEDLTKLASENLDTVKRPHQ